LRTADAGFAGVGSPRLSVEEEIDRSDHAAASAAANFGRCDGNLIWVAVVLSRLIRNNAHSFEFTARIVTV